MTGKTDKRSNHMEGNYSIALSEEETRANSEVKKHKCKEIGRWNTNTACCYKSNGHERSCWAK